jgi:hypothetical protein
MAHVLSPLDHAACQPDFDRSGEASTDHVCWWRSDRPRCATVVGHLHGIFVCRKRQEAFASGHALHMGALASAAAALPAGVVARCERLPFAFR